MGLFLDDLMAAIQKHFPWAGFILVSILGGITAHIREWEAKNPGYTFRQHLCAIGRRSFMAVTAGGIWYAILKANNWVDSPYGYVGASLVGLFAPEFFDWLWGIFKQRLGGVANANKLDGK